MISRALVVLRTGLLLIVSAALAGCRGCANDHPYVPPAVSATPIGADGGAIVTQASDDAGTEPALVAPPASTSWQVGGMKLEAGGREVVLAIVGDFDGDGKKDALAIVRPMPNERRPGSSTGDLVFFHGGDPPAAIATGPALGVQPGCTPVARLERAGRRNAFAEIGTTCRGTTSRSIFVVRLAGAMPSLAFDAEILDPAQAPKLAIDLDVGDRDKDGLDDVVLRLGLDGAMAKLAFFDRPAGPSRDPDEPEASLKAIATLAVQKAPKTKEAPAVPQLVEQMRALYRAMCSEGGAPRVTKIHGGSAIACGPSKPLEDAGVAEVRAYALQGDVLRAYATSAIAQVAPATKTAAKTAELNKLLFDAAPVVEAKSTKVLAAAVDAVNDRHPAWSSLAFDSAGKLLVKHGKSVTKVDPATGDEAASDAPAWSDEVLSPDGGKSRFIEAYNACEGVSLHATFAPTGDGDMADVSIPIAPRLGKTCNGKKGDPVSAVPLSWGPQGLEAVVAGQPVMLHLEPPAASPLGALYNDPAPPGSARSPGGKAFAMAAGVGILVRAHDKWQLVHSVLAEPFTDLHGCVIDDEATQIACVRRGKAVLLSL